MKQQRGSQAVPGYEAKSLFQKEFNTVNDALDAFCSVTEDVCNWIYGEFATTLAKAKKECEFADKRLKRLQRAMDRLTTAVSLLGVAIEKAEKVKK